LLDLTAPSASRATRFSFKEVADRRPWRLVRERWARTVAAQSLEGLDELHDIFQMMFHGGLVTWPRQRLGSAATHRRSSAS
jgi:hypothetical protein